MIKIKNAWVFATVGDDLLLASKSDVDGLKEGKKHFPVQLFNPRSGEYTEVKPLQVWLKWLYYVKDLDSPYEFSESKGGRGSGNWGHSGRPGHVGGSGGRGSISYPQNMLQYQVPADQRVWQGVSQSGSGLLSKLEAGARGEKVAAHALSLAFGEEFHTVNVGINNAPVDLAGASLAVEVKTGLASNSDSAQHWRATIGQPGKAEAEALKQMSKEQKRAHNEFKEQEILRRKRSFIERISNDTGQEFSPVTVGVILEPGGKRADVFLFDGFHLRIPWKDGTGDENYLGTFDVPEVKGFYSGRQRRWFFAVRSQITKQLGPRDSSDITTLEQLSAFGSTANIGSGKGKKTDKLPAEIGGISIYTHATRSNDQIDSILEDGIRPSGGQVFSSQEIVRDRGGGFVIFHGQGLSKPKEGIDVVEEGLSFPEYVFKEKIPPQNVVKVVREITTSSGHTVREDWLAKYASEHQGENSQQVKDLPKKYQAWFNLASSEKGFYSGRQRRWFFATMGKPGGVQTIGGKPVVRIERPKKPAAVDSRMVGRELDPYKDIPQVVATIESDEGYYPKSALHQDGALGQIIQSQGFDGKPHVVTRAELDKYIADGEIAIFRGVQPSLEDQKKAGAGEYTWDNIPNSHAEQYRSGEFFVGLGVHGNGVYASTKKVTAQSYASTLRDRDVLHMTLKKGSRVITDKELRDKMRERDSEKDRKRQERIEEATKLLKSGDKEAAIVRFNELQAEWKREDRQNFTENQIFNDPGRAAAMLGYDAIRVNIGVSEDYYVILNRTATRVAADE